ncbi:TlpA family protein disulfide reductase [Microbacterium thalassium]|uniref:Thiol-disulfide isomerase/thioredoxin n=1 Tax=Microbacterium thalassium TaxID=362649 RepID=A0A7X0KW65_9MICO|nr:TlpA disulfide reductase family protein [Microbacterium thalassium]MBB6392957.1 thiol-disulfide isomerase/thioredoxin [Microbacterium thalassium]GLK22811.1 thiol-disulfide isomerase [Microbacterium thalassium]
MTSLTRRARAAASALAALALTAGIAGCSSDPLAEQYRAGDNKGFIAADGFRVVEIAADDRGEPVEFTGVLDTGDTVTAADYEGDVLVVNFWYAGCAPCRAEAPELEAAYADLDGEAVSFLGVNIYDGADASLAFADTYGIEYPSALATVDGSIKLAFADETPLNAVPTTLVLDKEGRVAARIIGRLADASILTTIVDDALEES